MKCLDAQLVFVPGLMYEHLEHNDLFVSDLLDLEKLIETFGLETVASYVSLGHLYNPESPKNLLSPLIDSFQSFDWSAEPMSVLRDKQPEVAIRLQRTIDGLVLQAKPVSDQFVTGSPTLNSNDMDKDVAVPMQLYVPEIFLIKGHTYGVRLNAVAVEAEAEVNTTLADTFIAVLNQLSKFFNIKQIASTAVFQAHVKTAML